MELVQLQYRADEGWTAPLPNRLDSRLDARAARSARAR